MKKLSFLVLSFVAFVYPENNGAEQVAWEQFLDDTINGYRRMANAVNNVKKNPLNDPVFAKKLKWEDFFNSGRNTHKTAAHEFMNKVKKKPFEFRDFLNYTIDIRQNGADIINDVKKNPLMYPELAKFLRGMFDAFNRCLQNPTPECVSFENEISIASDPKELRELFNDLNDCLQNPDPGCKGFFGGGPREYVFKLTTPGSKRVHDFINED